MAFNPLSVRQAARAARVAAHMQAHQNAYAAYWKVHFELKRKLGSDNSQEFIDQIADAKQKLLVDLAAARAAKPSKARPAFTLVS